MPGTPLGSIILMLASACGSIHVLQWLAGKTDISKIYIDHRNIFHYAIFFAQPHMLLFLLSRQLFETAQITSLLQGMPNGHTVFEELVFNTKLSRYVATVMLAQLQEFGKLSIVDYVAVLKKRLKIVRSKKRIFYTDELKANHRIKIHDSLYPFMENEITKILLPPNFIELCASLEKKNFQSEQKFGPDEFRKLKMLQSKSLFLNVFLNGETLAEMVYLGFPLDTFKQLIPVCISNIQGYRSIELEDEGGDRGWIISDLEKSNVCSSITFFLFNILVLKQRSDIIEWLLDSLQNDKHRMLDNLIDIHFAIFFSYHLLFPMVTIEHQVYKSIVTYASRMKNRTIDESNDKAFEPNRIQLPVQSNNDLDENFVKPEQTVTLDDFCTIFVQMYQSSASQLKRSEKLASLLDGKDIVYRLERDLTDFMSGQNPLLKSCSRKLLSWRSISDSGISIWPKGCPDEQFTIIGALLAGKCEREIQQMISYAEAKIIKMVKKKSIIKIHFPQIPMTCKPVSGILSEYCPTFASFAIDSLHDSIQTSDEAFPQSILSNVICRKHCHLVPLVLDALMKTEYRKNSNRDKYEMVGFIGKTYYEIFINCVKELCIDDVVDGLKSTMEHLLKAYNVNIVYSAPMLFFNNIVECNMYFLTEASEGEKGATSLKNLSILLENGVQINDDINCKVIAEIVRYLKRIFFQWHLHFWLLDTEMFLRGKSNPYPFESVIQYYRQENKGSDILECRQYSTALFAVLGRIFHVEQPDLKLPFVICAELANYLLRRGVDPNVRVDVDIYSEDVAGCTLRAADKSNARSMNVGEYLLCKQCRIRKSSLHRDTKYVRERNEILQRAVSSIGLHGKTQVWESLVNPLKLSDDQSRILRLVMDFELSGCSIDYAAEPERRFEFVKTLVLTHNVDIQSIDHEDIREHADIMQNMTNMYKNTVEKVKNTRYEMKLDPHNYAAIATDDQLTELQYMQRKQKGSC